MNRKNNKNKYTQEAKILLHAAGFASLITFFSLGVLCGCTITQQSPLLIDQYKLQAQQIGSGLDAKNYRLCRDCLKYTNFQKQSLKQGAIHDDKNQK